MTATHVAVVGAGAAGLATAAELARRGARVTVLEAATVASGSSSRSAGVFNRQTPNAIEQELRCFTVDALSALERAGELSLERHGYVRVARRPDDAARLEGALARGAALGVADARLIGPDELAALVPGMRVDDVLVGLWCPSDGHLDGNLLCGAYRARAEADGAELRTRTPVERIDVRAGGATVAAGGARIECDVVVNAAGAWAGRVATLAGARLPLVNQLHEIAIVHLPAPPARHVPMVNLYVPGSGVEALWFRGEGPERLLVGSHAHEVLAGHAVDDPDAYRRQVSDAFCERIAEALLDRLPGLDDPRLEPGWTGLYPTSPDALPQIGPHPDLPRLVSVAGLGGTGLTCSAAAGRIAAEWILDGAVTSFAFADALLPDRPAPGDADA